MMTLDRFTRADVELFHPESPRWKDGAFWFSDYHKKTVNRMVPGEPPEVILQLDDSPSALGFMPDGALIFASMKKRQLFVYRDEKVSLHADMQHLPGQWLNDMVVDGDGRTYVGTRTTMVSPTMHFRDPGGPDVLLVVEPDGKTIQVVDNICSPNGASVSADGRTFTLAEIYARRIAQFDRDEQGRLSNKRIVAEFDDLWPDGISVDAEGAIWFGSPYSGHLVRVLADGTIDQKYAMTGAVACMLGGEDRRTLFVLATDVRRAPRSDPSSKHGSLYRGPGHETEPKRAIDDPEEVDTSGLFTMKVDVPGAGWP